jgi:hypothetical protein
VWPYTPYSFEALETAPELLEWPDFEMPALPELSFSMSVHMTRRQALTLRKLIGQPSGRREKRRARKRRTRS